MSEYQYYEFQAVDRPLSQRQMAELRKLSTRAEITPTSFTNEYHWGNFRGNPRKMMQTYFDAFVYYANWGTHWFMLRLPSASVDMEAIEAFGGAGCLSVNATANRVILEFSSEDEEGDWDGEGENWMASLLPLRADVLAGDLRSLYLGWLAGLTSGDVEDDDLEPPVPPGLGKLSAPLRSLAGFLRVDDDLLAVAAKPSEDAVQEVMSDKDLAKHVHHLPESDKDAFLLRVLKGDPTVRQDLLQQARRAATAGQPKAKTAGPARRTVADLREAAESRAGKKRRRG